MSTILVNKVQNLTGQTLTLDADFVNITGAVATFTGGSGVQVGVTTSNEIDTTGGLNLILDSSGGTVEIDDNLLLSGNISSTGATVVFNDNIDSTGSLSSSNINIGVTTNSTIDTDAGNLVLDSSSSTVQVSATTLLVENNITVDGNLTVNGTTTTVNSTTVTIDDPIFTLGGDSAPASDDNKDRGIEFRWHNGSTAKVGFFGFDDSTGHLTFIPDATNSSEVFSGTQGAIDVNEYYIGGTPVLNSTTLGSGVITSSLTSVGTIGTGTWQGSTIGTAYGGTGQTSLGAVDAADFGSQGAGSNSGYVLTADGSNNAVWAAPGGVSDGDKGDIVISNTGATWTIDNGVVGEDKITSALSGGGNATNTYVLTADGSGNVNWAAPSGGGISEAQAIAYAIAL